MNREEIIANEGGILTNGYVPMRGKNPATKNSGVTISSGVDLGHQNEESLRKLGASDALIKQLKPYLGKKGKEAVEALNKKPLQISEQDAKSLSDGKFSVYEAKARKSVEDAGGGWDALPDVLKTGIVDVVVNTGGIGDNTLSSIIRGDYAEVANNFDNYFGSNPDSKIKSGELAEHNVTRTKRTAENLRRFLEEQELAELEAELAQEDETGVLLERELGEFTNPTSSPPLEAEKKYGALETAARMGTQGATFGWGDEIGGLMQEGIGKVSSYLGGVNPYEVDADLIAQGFTGDLQPSAYDAGVADEREKIASMRENNPKLSLASEMVGGIAGDALLGGNPVLGGALYGAGEADGDLGDRAIGAAVGGAFGAAIPLAGARLSPYVGGGVRKMGGAIADAIAPVSKEVSDRFNHQIAPGIKNIYTAISGNIQQQDVPVLEAMTRQKDLFFNKPVKQNTKAAQAVISEEMTKLNSKLADMTRKISDETGDQILSQFDVVADRLRREADLSNSESLRRLADTMDDAVLSGDYQAVLDAYKKNIRSRRQYSPDGKITRYRGSNADILEEVDMLFEDTNRAFIDDMSRVVDFNLSDGTMNPSASKYGLDFKDTMSRLRDLHIVDAHLDKAARHVRKSGFDSVQLRDSLLGGAAGGIIGGAVGLDPYTSGMAGVYLGATGRRSIVANNIIANLKNKVSPLGATVRGARGLVSRSLQGAIDLAATHGAELAEMGVDSAILSQLSKAASAGILDVSEAESAATALMNQAPELFEQGAYASEIDGRITSPDDLQREQVRINTVLKGNNIEKAKALTALNRDGTIYKGDSKNTKLIKPVKSSILPNAPTKQSSPSQLTPEESEELKELEAIFGKD